MSLINRFVEYAMAFEETYVDDNWARLEAFYHPEAVYEVCNTRFNCLLAGREAIFSGIEQSINGFDRHCVRKLGGLDAYKKEEGNKVLVYSKITYQRGESPPLEASLWEIATFENGRIKHLMDIYDAHDDEKFDLWMAKWGEGLDASYVQPI